MGDWRGSATLAVALLLVCASMVGGFAVGTATAASSNSAPVGVFTDGSGTLTVLYSNGSTVSLGVSGELVGPMTNLDADKYLEAPFAKSGGGLYVIDTAGESQSLGVSVYTTSKASLATGDWDDDGRPAIIYQNANGKLARIEVGGSPQTIGSTFKTNGPIGVTDFDGDGDEDVVFLGGSSVLKYYDGSTLTKTGYSNFGGNGGGLGIGALADFDGDGQPRVPHVTGSNYVALVGPSGNGVVLNSTSAAKAAKTHVAAANWAASDSELEILYVDYGSDPDPLRYMNLNGTFETVSDASGGTITPNIEVGIMSAATPPAPAISNYSVSNPSGRELRVTFNSSEKLVDITVTVDGPDAHDFNLTEANFTETGNGPYQYTATTTVAVDGSYTATLAVAKDADGADGGTGQNGTVSIQTPYPNVTNVTLTDATNDDGYVGGGDTVHVTATVKNESTVTSVTANASAFGAGTVALSHVSGDTYAANFTVDASGVPADGPADVAVTATNEYDHSNTSSSGTVFVDTTPPNADAGPDMTIEEDTEATFDGDGSTDNANIVGYTWTFDDGHTETGVTTTETFADPGTYTVDLTVTDTVGHTTTDTVTVTVENVSQGANLTVSDATLTDVTDNDGYVGGDDTVRVTATIENESAIKTVRADASKFGAGTVNLSHVSGDTYATTFTVDAADVADDGQTAIEVTAIDEHHHIDTGMTGELFVDTTSPTADAGANVTVEEGTRVVFDGAGSTDNAQITRYVWTLESGTTLIGVTPNHTFAAPGTYTVDLTVTDTVGHTATDTVTITVTNTSEGSTTTDVVYLGSDETVVTNKNDSTTETQTRNQTVGDETVTLRVHHVDANESVRFAIPENVSTAGARLRTVTVVTERNGTVRTWVTPNATAPAGVVGLGQSGHVEPVGYWNLTATNAESAMLRFQVPDSRLGRASPDAVSLYRYVEGTWKRIDAQHVTATDGTHQFVARVPNLSRTGIYGIGIRRGDLTVSTLVVSENSTVPDREVVVHATVTNDGARPVTDTLALTVNGTAIANRTVTIPAHGTRNLTFAFTPDAPGNYRLAVGKTDGETVSVHNASDATEDTQDDTTPVGGSALGLLGALALAGVSYGIGRSDVNPAELLE